MIEPLQPDNVNQTDTPTADQRGQTVGGPQTNIAGNVTGPVFSGQFQGPLNFGDIRVDNVHGFAAIGNGAQLIIKNALSAADEAREHEQLEQEKRARVVAQLTQTLFERANTPPSAQGNPYRYLFPYELDDTARFFGREADAAGLIDRLSRSRLTVLYGDARVGKTSLLQARLLPAILANQHLPLLVSVTSTPLVTHIKQRLRPDLNNSSDLAQTSLKVFLRQTASHLPKGKRVFILLDQFENFFQPVNAEHDQFVEALADCLSDELLSSQWLIGLRSAWFSNLDELPSQVLPFDNAYRLKGLTRPEASAAIVEPAQLHGLSVEAGLVTAILDDLNDSLIDPSQLQMVCQALAERLGPGDKQLTLDSYQRLGRATTILNSYFDEVLDRHVRQENRKTAWQTLAILVHQTRLTKKDLVEQLKGYGFEATQSHKAIHQLDTGRLIRLTDEHYELASDSLVPRIQRWAAEQAIADKIRAETRRQMAQIRGSALRGLVGGALGLVLAFLVAYQYSPTTSLPLVAYIAAYRALPGAFAGFLLVLSTDIALVSYLGPRRWLCWPINGLVGALAFGLAVSFHASLRSMTNLALATLEGAVWGLVAGLGLMWAMSRTRPMAQTALGVGVISLACGVALWLADHFGHAFALADRVNLASPPTVWVLVAGAVMPVCVFVAALLARKAEGE